MKAMIIVDKNSLCKISLLGNSIIKWTDQQIDMGPTFVEQQNTIENWTGCLHTFFPFPPRAKKIRRLPREETIILKENYNNIRQLETATRKDSTVKDPSFWMCQTKKQLKGNLLVSSEVEHNLVCYLHPKRLCHLLLENEPAIRLLNNMTIDSSIRKQKNLWWIERWIFVWWAQIFHKLPS